MALDVRTIGIFSAITPFVLGVIMLIYLRERKVYGGFKHWIFANFGLSAGYALVSLREFMPAFFSIFLGNCLTIFSLILIYQGIEQFYERPGFSRFNAILFGLFVGFQIYFVFWQLNTTALVAVSALITCILILHAGTRFFLVSVPQLRKTSRSAGYVFFTTALFPWMFFVSSLFASGPGAAFSHILNAWFSIVFIVSIVMWTFHFFFLNSARLELDLEATRAKVELISRIDPLTNLYNRRHFDEQAELEFLRSKRSGRPTSLLLLDMDGFKAINDVNGHAVGDSVLVSLSTVLRSELRPFDLIARYGGDEFIILLTDTNEEQAYRIADRIRKRIGLMPFVVGSRILTVTLSAGITSLNPEDTDLRAIIKRCDVALYRAKQKGRNRVIVQ